MKNIQVLERGLQVLDCVADNPALPQRLSELVRRTGLAAPTAARIVKTLENQGYLECLGRKTGYILGPRVGRLVNRFENRSPLLPIAQPLMGLYSEKTREFICLSTLEDCVRRFIHYIPSTHEIQVMGQSPGQDKPYNSVAARLLLAHAGPDARKRCLEVYGPPLNKEWQGVTTVEAFNRELDRMAEVDSWEERREQITAMAWLVRCPGQPLAALGSYIPNYRYKGAHRRQVRTLLLEMVELINRWPWPVPAAPVRETWIPSA